MTFALTLSTVKQTVSLQLDHKMSDSKDTHRPVRLFMRKCRQHRQAAGGAGALKGPFKVAPGFNEPPEIDPSRSTAGVFLDIGS